MKKRKGIALISAMMFNMLVCMALSAATGFSMVGCMVGGAIVSGLANVPAGSLGMAIQKEIWMNHIVEGLFADNSFLSKAYSADMFVNAGKTVHIPNAGSPSAAVKNRVTKPATVNQRTDTALSFNLDEFTTDPIYIPNADTVELSYNKRESVLRTDKNALQEVVSNAFLFYWAPAANNIGTSGAAVAAHTDSATGNRKKIVKADVLSAMTQMNTQNIPQEGRYLLLDAVMYSQLLDDLTTQESQSFLASANAQQGVVGKLFGFNVMLRSKALRYDNAGVAKEWTDAGAATDNAAALAWHTDAVCRALGEVKAFETVSDPTYYGDIYSFLVRAGGRPMRGDGAGILAIVQTATA